MVKDIDANKNTKIAEIAKDLCSRYPMCTCVERGWPLYYSNAPCRDYLRFGIC